MRYAFTGPARVLTKSERDFIQKTIYELDPKPTALVSGGAHGVDTEAWNTFHAHRFLNVPRVVVYPLKKWHNESLVRDSIVLGDRYVPVAGGYMKRNDRLVAEADILVAFPETPRERLRSGTWATVRRARKAGKEVRIYPLNEAR